MKKTIFAVFTAFSLLAASCGDEKPAAKSIYQKCVDYYKKQADCLLTMQQGASSDCIFLFKDADFLNSLPQEKIEEILMKNEILKSKTDKTDDVTRCMSRANEDKIECLKNINLIKIEKQKEICNEFK